MLCLNSHAACLKTGVERWRTVVAAVALILLSLMLSVPAPLFADAVSTPEKVSPPTDAVTSPGQIESLWSRIRVEIQRNDRTVANDLLLELLALRRVSGLEGLDRHADFLIQVAVEKLESGAAEEGLFYVRKALALSPHSPNILLRALPWGADGGAGSSFNLAAHAVSRTLRSPFLFLSLVKRCIYPCLIAMTIALFLAFVLVIGSNIMDILRTVARAAGPQMRGIVSPVAVLVIFVTPIAFGPLWTLFAWGAAIRLLLPKGRFLSIATALTLILWGVFIPLRERIADWVENPQVQTLALTNTATISTQERAELARNIVDWNDDQIVLFKYGQLLRHLGDYGASEVLFRKVEALIGTQPWTIAERGMLAFLSGRADVADTLMTEAQGLGLDSVEFLFNFSKVRFELTDTKSSRELFALAHRKLQSRAEELKEKEDLLGMFHPRAVADIELPVQHYIQAALVPHADGFGRSQRVAATLMPGTDALSMTVIGVVLFLIYLAGGREPKRIKPAGYFAGYEPPGFLDFAVHLVPGGAMIVKQRPARGLALLALVLVLLAPLLEWPLPHSLFGEILPTLLPYYCCFFLLVYLGAVYAGYFGSEEI